MKVNMNNFMQSAGSQDQDQEKDRRRGEDHEHKDVFEESHVSLDKLYSGVFFWCRVMGLHGVTRNKKGEYVVSGLSLAPCLVISVFAMVCLGIEVWILNTPLPFWFSVVLSSIACGYGFCLYASAQGCWNAGRMKRYMAVFPDVKGQRDTWSMKAVAGALLYPLLVAVIMNALLPEWTGACLSVFINFAVPAFLDAYMTCFSRTLKKGLEDLGLEVQRRDSWMPVHVSGVSSRWVALTQLLQKHNEVSEYCFGLYVELF